MTRVFIFDFFDVIHADYQKRWLAANGFTRSGGFAEASDLLDVGKIGFAEYLQRYADLSGRSPEQVLDEFQAYAKLNEPLVEVIGRLHETARTCLISNTHSDEIRPILDRHNLVDLFHEICISSDIGIAKPDPRIFQHMIDTLGVSPDECVFFDDNPANVKVAQSLGMQGVVYTDFEQFMRALQELDVSLDSSALSISSRL